MKFRKGQWVRVTKLGEPVILNEYAKNHNEYGIVVGFANDGKCVRILRDGQKTVSNYHQDFWEPINILEDSPGL